MDNEVSKADFNSEMSALDKAIAHAREVAEHKRKCNENSDCIDIECEQCAEEHEHLAEWLEKLKAYEQQYLALCDKFGVNSVEDLYSKAVDEACEYIKREWCVDNLHFCSDFDKIAERLKESSVTNQENCKPAVSRPIPDDSVTRLDCAIRKIQCEQELNNTPSVDVAYSLAVASLQKQKELVENCRGKCSECRYCGEFHCANDLLIDGLEV